MKSFLIKASLVLTGLLYIAPLWAGPAPWYRWRSEESNVDICSQTSPGEGWVAAKGPYQDAVCKKAGVPH